VGLGVCCAETAPAVPARARSCPPRGRAAAPPCRPCSRCPLAPAVTGAPSRGD